MRLSPTNWKLSRYEVFGIPAKQWILIFLFIWIQLIINVRNVRTFKGKQSSISELRSSTAAELRSSCDEYLPFLSHPDTGDMLNPEQFATYCSDVAKTSAWGGQVELGALSKVLKTCMWVTQTSWFDPQTSHFYSLDFRVSGFKWYISA